ncbi:MAG: helix-turn-helix domain-containing protein [Candidatus Nanopelagicales bacterium]
MTRPAPSHTLQLVPPTPRNTSRTEPPQLIDVTLRTSDRMLLTVEEAADRLRIGRTMMYELIRTRQIRTITVGRLRRVEPDALSEYVKSSRTQAG